MRIAFAAAAAALCLSTPAFATGGFECRPIAGAGPVLTVGIGHGLSLRPFTVWLREGKHLLAANNVPQAGDALALGQTWIDPQYLWVDLLDPKRERIVARLRATFQPKMKYRPAMGALVRNGRTYRVRCVEA